MEFEGREQTMFRLDGKTALVTGASQGIGEGIARGLAAQGARLVLAARSEDKLTALAEAINADGGAAHALALDLGEPATLGDRLKALPEDFANIDILVNNAGITADNLLLRMSLEDWQRVLDINLTGTFALTKLMVKGMMRRRWGRIITVSSVVGMMGNAGQANYAAAKAGLIGFSKSVARELGSRNITANVVAPGYIETAMTADLPPEAHQGLADSIVLKRLGTVQDIVGPVAFLASDEASYITGHVLNVSGGMYI
jgi:3-oxoacyl-[acyl-carrier protein] reductase